MMKRIAKSLALLAEVLIWKRKTVLGKCLAAVAFVPCAVLLILAAPFLSRMLGPASKEEPASEYIYPMF